MLAGYCNCYCPKSLLIYPALGALLAGALVLAAFYIFIKKEKHEKPHLSLLKTSGMVLFFLGFVLLLVYLLMPFIMEALLGGPLSWWQTDCLRADIY